ncbi:MAG TPA: GDSL-type esterase/lipase family protein [Stellaceae bacterium]|nr:GDSL-type esterase/lipase family protein [Stellaceae bacterium]
MRARSVAALTLSGLLILADPIGPAWAEDACAVAPEWVSLARPLPETHRRLVAGEPLRIVAIGTSSTVGMAAGGKEHAFPERLAVHLRAALPKIPITVENRGAPRQSARQMVDRFPTDVIAEKPALVIWEVGTNDAVRSIDMDEFGDALQSGIDLLKAAGIDLLFMDLQFSRSTSSVINFEPYLKTLTRMAEVNDVPVFHRYEIMRAWDDLGTFDLDESRPAQRIELARKVYDCIGAALAQTIGQAAR